MNKIVNWVGGSFFRTIGRILVYIFIAFILSIILSENNIKLPSIWNVLNVDAYETFPPSNDIWFTVNGNISSPTTRVFTNTGNVEFRLFSNLAFIPSYDDNQIKYGYLSVCAATPFDLTTYSSGYYTKNLKVYNTSVPCQFYNTSAYPDSHVVYMIFELNLGLGNPNSQTMCQAGASSTLCTLDNHFTLYVPRTNEWILNSFGFSQHPFEYDTASSTLISQNQTIINQNNQIINKQQQTIDSINDSNTSQATSSASDFFSNFTTNNHGLTGIITAPLSAIQSLTSSTCSDLVLPLPFVNQNLTLPCMRSIYDQHFGNFMTIYDTITLGIISYWVMVRIFALVKDFKNPEHDEIEVVDL